MEFTLFEVHLPDAEFNAPFARREAGAVGDTSTTPVPEGGPAAPLGRVVALLAMVGIAVLARYLRGGDGAQTTLDEVEA